MYLEFEKMSKISFKKNQLVSKLTGWQLGGKIYLRGTVYASRNINHRKESKDLSGNDFTC